MFDGLEGDLEVVEFIAALDPDVRMAVEALGLNRWFVNACLEGAIDIFV